MSSFPLPPPPYTYDDPRITYDEQCFFYDGGYDLVCLVSAGKTGKRKVGRSSRTGKTYPQPETVSLIFKSCITNVNEKEFIDRCDITRYEIKRSDNIKIKTDGINIKIKDTKINSQFITGSIDKNLKNYVSSSLHFNKPNKIKVISSIIKKDTENN